MSKWQRCPGNAELQLGRRETDTRLEPGAPRKSAPRGWYSRGYLPHMDVPGLVQSVTFRLADSLPRENLYQMERELAALCHAPEAWSWSSARYGFMAELELGAPRGNEFPGKINDVEEDTVRATVGSLRSPTFQHAGYPLDAGTQSYSFNSSVANACCNFFTVNPLKSSTT